MHARGTVFRIAATAAKRCAVRLYNHANRAGATVSMHEVERGVFEVDVDGVDPGTRYRIVLDGKEHTDPWARWLPEGIGAPAAVVRPEHGWKHAALGRAGDLAIYELHVGTFTTEGTYRGAGNKLRELADLGITAIELLPIAAFPGRWGWGYDGVLHFAPFAPYGTPDDLRAFIDEAHGLGLRVILDVVYNHFGPSGNELRGFVPEAFTRDIETGWGEGPSFSNPVMRDYVIENVRYWLEDFRFDGLRLDATHAIADARDPHVLTEIASIAHAMTPERMVIAEDDRNDPAIVGVHGFDAVWADDFHHQVRVSLTGEQDGYYAAYPGGPKCLAQTIEQGWMYVGQEYPPRGEPRGKPARKLPARAFVYCIQNHDQIGNRAFGDRLTDRVSIEAYCAASLLLLALPMTPMLFMGQEWAATTPFLFFTDHDAELGKAVTEGRRKEFQKFEAFADPASAGRIPDPQAESTFTASRLDWAEAGKRPHAQVRDLYRALLHLRRTDPVLSRAAREHMSAWAENDVLYVDLRVGRDARRIVVNLTDRDQIARADRFDEARWRPLVTSRPVRFAGAVVPRHSAALLAGTVET